MAAIVWKGYLTFGLVSLPVRLYAAGRAEAVHFHMLHRKDLSRVKEVWYCVREGKPTARSEIVKGYETSQGRYVAVEDSELKDIAPATATTMEVVQFVAADEVDPIYFERSYYVAPDEKISKPFALFLHALEETKHDAIAKLSMHNREHVVLIRAAGDSLILHTLFYADELHQANRKPSPKSSPGRKELDLAKAFIQRLSGPFEPKQFHDVYQENVEELIQQKRKGEKIVAMPQPKRAPVIDLMDALRRSLKQSEAPSKTRKSKPRRAAKKASGRRTAA